MDSSGSSLGRGGAAAGEEEGARWGRVEGWCAGGNASAAGSCIGCGLAGGGWRSREGAAQAKLVEREGEEGSGRGRSKVAQCGTRQKRATRGASRTGQQAGRRHAAACLLGTMGSKGLHSHRRGRAGPGAGASAARAARPARLRTKSPLLACRCRHLLLLRGGQAVLIGQAKHALQCLHVGQGLCGARARGRAG